MIEYGRAFQVREVCADFEELRGFKGDCQCEGISDEGQCGGGWGSGILHTYVTKILHAPKLFVVQVYYTNIEDPTEMLFSLPIIPKTISANPLARLLLIDCWRSIVFLII